MAHFNYLFVLVSFAFIISSGIFIFSRGFLLTRIARTEKRNCDKFYLNFDGKKQCLSDDKKICSNDQQTDINFLLQSSDKICFERKSKIVLFVVDALKHEFGMYNESLKEPLPYQNKLPIIHELRKKHPDRTRMLKFFADPPTTTLQRLKGITTGSLPTFIDMGSNFASPEINEDNVIDQMKANGLSVVFMGDGTWTELFPKRFKRKYSYPSFNIHDLDTIDNAILNHLPDEMAQQDWDVLIAHFLGIDHCGHKYGPLHPEMARKITEMNEVIKNYAENLDDDTILLVVGDHGMTYTGDHGGASNDEVEALLFAYSKKPFVSSTYDENVDFIQQIDFTATVATILGIPVPFSNLGTISLQLLPDMNYNDIPQHQLLAMHLWHNAKQILNYFDKYSEDEDIFEDQKTFDAKFKELEKQMHSIKSDEEFQLFANDLRKELNNILEMCREAWINFNPQLMTQGMLIAFLGIFVAFILTYNVPQKDFAAIYNRHVIIFQMAFTIISGAFGFMFHKTFSWDESIVGALFMSSMANALVFGYLIISRWMIIVEEMMAAKKLTNLVPRLIYVLSIGVFFSNSFIVQEQKILCYMLSIQVIYALYEIRKFTTLADFKNVKLKTAIIMKSIFMKILCVVIMIVVLLRVSQHYFKCREEQGDCWDFTTNSDAFKPKDAMSVTPAVLLALFIVIARIFLKTNGNLTGFSPHVIFIKFGPTLSVIAACGHLLITQKQKRQIIPYVHFDTLAWVVYAILAIEIFMIVISPLLIYIMPRENERLNVNNYNTAITEIFRQIKSSYREESKDPIPIVYGLATVYSSVFLALGKILVITLAILVGAYASNGLVILMTIAIGCLFVFSVLRFESSSDLKECLQPRFSLIITWYLLYSYGFYCTSHQPTISQIDWNAAFVGRTASYDHSNFISALLVLASTFNANIVFLVLYPLMVLFPFMLYAIYPQLCSSGGGKNKNNSEYKRVTLNTDSELDEKASSVANVTRGEINLFEHEKPFLSSVFKVGCQLIILQGTKAFASMIACTILCRHLMVWKIFAPRFIYEGIASYISFSAIILGFLLMLRVHKSVKSLVDKVSKNC